MPSTIDFTDSEGFVSDLGTRPEVGLRISDGTTEAPAAGSGL